MRFTNSFPIALLMIVVCQGHGALRSTSGPQANAQPDVNANATSPHIVTATPVIAATFTDADFARHVALLKSEIKQKVTSRPADARD